MKRLALTSLLAATYIALMSGFFSTDFSKEHSFLFEETSKTNMTVPQGRTLGELPATKLNPRADTLQGKPSVPAKNQRAGHSAGEAPEGAY